MTGKMGEGEIVLAGAERIVLSMEALSEIADSPRLGETYLGRMVIKETPL